MDKKRRLELLREEWDSCTRCDIRSGTDTVCFGAGASRATFLFITDRPDFEDAINGAPLLEGAGQSIFSTTLEHSNIDPGDIFVTPLVGCVPYLIKPATEETEQGIEVRPPTREEVHNCLARIHEIIYLVDPRVIITLGEMPWKHLVSAADRGRSRTITAAQGKMFECRIPGRIRELRYPLVAAPGIDQILKNPSVSKHGPTAVLVRSIYTAAHHTRLLQKMEQDNALPKELTE